jgi:hypothetical protein
LPPSRIEPPPAIRGASSHDERDGLGFEIRLDAVQAPAFSTFELIASHERTLEIMRMDILILPQ